MQAKKLKKLINSKQINLKNVIDIREYNEVKMGSIKGIKNIPMDKLLKEPNKYLNKNETYYLMCQSGGRSLSAWLNLRLKRYKVKNISGGYLAYK